MTTSTTAPKVRWTADQKRKAVDQVLSGKMPKDGQPLTVEETALFFADWMNCVPRVNATNPPPDPAPPPMN